MTDVSSCQRCEICTGHPVPGDGPLNAEIMFIGEAPGFHEEQTGHPFVGQSGLVLDELLSLIGLTREQVFIDNVVKCRPPNNRDPKPEEIQNCAEWLQESINTVKPKVVVTLGRFAAAQFFPTDKMGTIHGTTCIIDGVTYYAMYHPAATLYNSPLLKVLQQDILRLPAIIEGHSEQVTEIDLF